MKTKTFRLEEKYIELLKDYALKNSITQTAALQNAIQNLDNAVQEQYGQKDELVDELRNQRDYLQEQNIELLKTIQATQTVRALESVEQKETRWMRLKQAWRG